MHARVLRIGQLSGDRRSAIWNDTEAIALMVRSALTVRALPALHEQPSWLPVDACAEAVVEIAVSGREEAESPEKAHERTRDDDADRVYHLVNPQTFNWSGEFLPALKKCGALPDFDIVSPQEWILRLAGSEQDAAKNPSIKLLDFWRFKYGNANAATDSEMPAGLTFETKRTLLDCKALEGVGQPVADGLVERYVKQWMKKWSV
jgi:thioester reductase-like protein